MVVLTGVDKLQEGSKVTCIGWRMAKRSRRHSSERHKQAGDGKQSK